MIVDPVSVRYLANILETRTGQQLSENRLWRVETILKSLLRERGFPSLAALVVALVDGREAALADTVVEAMLNNETFFFRDHAVFALVESGGLPELRKRRADTRRLRIWCAGCSTGQEAYSIAMLFADAAAWWAGWSIDLLATDVSYGAIAQARDGRFSQFEIQRGLPIGQMLRWFDQEGEDWRVKRALAGKIRFRQHNLLDRPPAGGPVDLILCRNVLLYLTPDRRRVAFDNLRGAIAPDGYLVLGAGETVIGQTEAFESDRESRGLYRPASPRAAIRAA